MTFPHITSRWCRRDPENQKGTIIDQWLIPL